MFFEQINDIPLDEVYKSQNVIVSTHEGWDWYNPYIYEQQCLLDWRESFRKYLKIKDEAMRYIIKLYNRTIQKGKVLGVIGRGTDCRSSRGMMPEPMEIYAFIREVKKALEIWDCDSIFLATEDQQTYEIFMESDLKNIIQVVDQYRVDYSDEKNRDLLLSEIKIRENKNGYMDSLTYLGILYILSKCDSLISTCPCGALNFAIAFNDGKYNHIKYFEK